jgi:integrase
MATALRERRAKAYRGDAFPVWSTPDRRTKSGAVIPGKTLVARNVRRDALDPATKALGLGWVGFHTFRHTCASLLFAGGKDVKQVQEWLGHADPGFTLRAYVHLMDEGLGSADFLDVVVTSEPRDDGPVPVP